MTVAAALQYQTVYNRLRLLAAQHVERLWDTTGGLTDEQAATFARLASLTVEGAAVATARLVAAYIGSQGGSRPTINVRPLRTLRGVDLLDVYHRPIVEARTAIADGKTFDEAMRFGRIRAGSAASTDVMLTQRHATIEALRQTPRAVGYRRVLTGQSCNLCATASTQRYHKAQLAPLHNFCDCSVAPIIGTSDPGHVINSKLLQQLKDKTTAEGVVRSNAGVAAQKNASKANARIREIRGELADATGKRRTQLENQLAGWQDRKTNADTAVVENRRQPNDEPAVAVHVHGELGPMLTVKGQHFDGPSAVN